MSKGKKIFSAIQNHFVEFVGFVGILFVIIVISYLKYYKKTYVCTSRKIVDNITVNEKFTIKQKNNKIITIDFDYTAKLSDTNKTNLKKLYNEALTSTLNEFDNVKTSYDNNTIKISYTLTKDDIKDNKAYKSAKVFMRNIKANGFSCK